MQHTGHFDTLLRDTVNLPQGRLDQLSGRVDAIYGALRADTTLGDLVTGKTRQGSWAHRTIIKPPQDKEYDADVLVHFSENQDWARTKAEYINELYRALGRSGYEDRHRKTRCVRVQYANDCHIDLVPYVTTSSGAKHIVNRSTGEWEDTNPDGFTTWMNARDEIAGGNFRKVVRLMKFLRDHKNSFTGTRSIILTTLLGERVSSFAPVFEPGAYGNVPKTLVRVVEDLDSWLQGQWSKPSVSDPSSPGTSFDHRWSDESFRYFKDRIHAHAAEMREAFDETDQSRSVEKWQALFGDGFKAASAQSSASKGPFVVAGVGASRMGASTGRSGRAG
ncbi:MAG: nucleotidyltransferase [Nigerium sp.]|nr:nucleotidyltransferase [Nigerium sp.]